MHIHIAMGMHWFSVAEGPCITELHHELWSVIQLLFEHRETMMDASPAKGAAVTATLVLLAQEFALLSKLNTRA